MALADIVAEVATRMTGVATWLGEEHLDRNDPPPRVVWIPTEDSYAGASKSARGDLARAPRTIRTCNAGVELHIHGAGAVDDTDLYKDLRATEALRDRLLWFLHQVTWGSYAANGGRWLPANVNTFGRVYLLQIQLQIPIAPAAADIATAVTTFTNVDPMEGTQVSPSGDITGTPAP